MARANQDAREPGLYEREYYLWIEQQVSLLGERPVDELDVANLIDEVACATAPAPRAPEPPPAPDPPGSLRTGQIVCYETRTYLVLSTARRFAFDTPCGFG